MSDRVNNCFEKIKATGALPSPTGVAMEILRLANDEGTTLDQIATVIESDPAIAGRLLKYVNSPLAGMSRQIGSAARAVALVGLHTVKSISLGFSVMNHKPEHCTGFDHDQFWSECLARAVAARHVANKIRTFAPDEAFTCGLLSQIGRLAFASVFPDAYSHAMSLAESSEDEGLIEIEREMFEIDHSELSGRMMSEWNLPAVFCDAVRFQDDPESDDPALAERPQQLARILHLSGSVAIVLTTSYARRDALTDIVNEGTHIGIRPDVFYDVFDSIRDEWREAGAIFSVPTRKVLPLVELYARARENRDALHSQGSQPLAETTPADAR
jgi:HD-like signal output (HDOD) protein